MATGQVFFKRKESQCLFIHKSIYTRSSVSFIQTFSSLLYPFQMTMVCILSSFLHNLSCFQEEIYQAFSKGQSTITPKIKTVTVNQVPIIQLNSIQAFTCIEYENIQFLPPLPPQVYRLLLLFCFVFCTETVSATISLPSHTVLCNTFRYLCSQQQFMAGPPSSSRHASNFHSP